MLSWYGSRGVTREQKCKYINKCRYSYSCNVKSPASLLTSSRGGAAAAWQTVSSSALCRRVSAPLTRRASACRAHASSAQKWLVGEENNFPARARLQKASRPVMSKRGVAIMCAANVSLCMALPMVMTHAAKPAESPGCAEAFGLRAASVAPTLSAEKRSLGNVPPRRPRCAHQRLACHHATAARNGAASSSKVWREILMLRARHLLMSRIGGAGSRHLNRNTVHLLYGAPPRRI